MGKNEDQKQNLLLLVSQKNVDDFMDGISLATPFSPHSLVLTSYDGKCNALIE